MPPPFARVLLAASSAMLVAACSLAERITRDGVTPGETLYILEHGGPVSQAQAGDTLALAVGRQECCVYYEEIEADVSWSVEPGHAASIDAAGVLSVAPNAPPGTVLTVTAVLAASGQTVSAPITVYTPEANPLVGRWKEELQYTCETGEAFAPPDPIQELIFEADQTINVTWFPFEIYVDYWGRYKFDLEQGTLSIQVEGGNYVPPDFDGEGTFTFDEGGGLVLVDIWLGTPPAGWQPTLTPGGPPLTGPLNCGHRFVR